MDAWESKVVELKKEHGEEPTTGLKASLLLEMLPDQVQLTVAQGLSSKKLDHDTLKAKIKTLERWSTMSTTRTSRLSRYRRARVNVCHMDLVGRAVGIT